MVNKHVKAENKKSMVHYRVSFHFSLWALVGVFTLMVIVGLQGPGGVGRCCIGSLCVVLMFLSTIAVTADAGIK